MKKILIATLIASFSTFNAFALEIGHIEVDKPWARATTKMAMSSGAYITLKNYTGTDDALISAKTPIAQKTELHETVMDESGRMEMRHMEKVYLPKDTFVKMEPGGLHIMFMGLNNPLTEGDEFPLELTFEHAPKQTIRVIVKPISYRGE